MTYLNTAEEPSLSLQSVTVSVTSPSETRTCNVSIITTPLNDHRPEIDLDGAASPSLNYTTSLTFSIFSAQSVAVASDDVIISDGDVDGVVESVRVELVEGREGDRLVLDETLCPDTTETICHLRFK